MSTAQTTKHATIVYIRGLPGSGKSYLASALRTALGNSTVMLDPDLIDFESTAYHEHVERQITEGIDAKLHAYRFLRAQTYSGIELGKTIIWNQPFTNLEIFHKMVGRMQDHAKEHDVQLSILIVEVTIDQETAKQRVTTRKQGGGHGPTDNTFGRFTNDYKSFANEGYTTVEVQGARTVSASVATVQQALHDLV